MSFLEESDNSNVSISEKDFRIQELEKKLENKELALAELLDQIEIEKQTIQNTLLEKIEQVVYPVLDLLKKTAKGKELDYLLHIQDFLYKITKPFKNEKILSFKSLTPKETQICHMIASGMTNKEIAQINNVSSLTIHTHRNRIRKKLGIKNQKINLVKHLRSCD